MKKLVLVLITILILGLSLYPVMSQDTARAVIPYPQSQNVAVIGGTYVSTAYAHFPTTGPFSIFNFTPMPYTTVSYAALAPYDTVLLNVASSGSGALYCDINRLTPQQKADLVAFVADGKKLIIYDSECSPQNYDWLPYPFETNNPGAQGAHGTCNIVENNSLSSDNPSDPSYINHTILESGTDAIGDMNVMTTYDSAWCLDISGTNTNNYTGPVHCYARYGNPGSMGLIIYNGMDVDYFYYYSGINTTTGPGNLAKIWYQELLTPFNPSDLPCGVTVVGLNLDPMTAVNDVGESHTVIATATDLLGDPVPDVEVTISVISGPNNGVSATDFTDADGEVNLTITSSTPGIDEIKACFTQITDPQGNPICTQIATKEWVVPQGAADLCPDEYRWSTTAECPYKWCPFPTTFKNWNDVHLVNNGDADALNVTATISCVPVNVTVDDGEVSFGDIPAGGGAWSGDDFALVLDMTNPQDPDKGICWTIEYDDASGAHYVVEDVAKFCGEVCDDICP